MSRQPAERPAYLRMQLSMNAGRCPSGSFCARACLLHSARLMRSALTCASLCWLRSRSACLAASRSCFCFARRAAFGRVRFTALRRDFAAPRRDLLADFRAGFRRFDDLALAISMLPCVPVDPVR